MKRIMLIITALLLVLSCSATVFAEDNADGGGFGGNRDDFSSVDYSADEYALLAEYYRALLAIAQSALDGNMSVLEAVDSVVYATLSAYGGSTQGIIESYPKGILIQCENGRELANIITDYVREESEKHGAFVPNFPLGDGQTEFDLGNGYYVDFELTYERNKTTYIPINGVNTHCKYYELKAYLCDSSGNIIDTEYGQGRTPVPDDGTEYPYSFYYNNITPVLTGNKLQFTYDYYYGNALGYKLASHELYEPLTIPDSDNVEITEKTEEETVENLTDEELADVIEDMLEALENAFPDLSTIEGLLQAILNKVSEILNKLDKEKDMDLSSIISRLDRLVELMKENNDLLGAIKELSEEEKEEQDAKWIELIKAVKEKFGYDVIIANIEKIKETFFSERDVKADISTGGFIVTCNNVTRSSQPQLKFTFLEHEYDLFTYVYAIDSVTLSTFKAFVAFMLHTAFIIGLFRSLPNILSSCGRVFTNNERE